MAQPKRNCVALGWLWACKLYDSRLKGAGSLTTVATLQNVIDTLARWVSKLDSAQSHTHTKGTKVFKVLKRSALRTFHKYFGLQSNN